MPTRVLNKVESTLVRLAIQRRDATYEAADTAFNHAVRPVLDSLGIMRGSKVHLEPREDDPDGPMMVSYEEAPVPPRAPDSSTS